MREIRKDLLPSFKKRGLHVVVDSSENLMRGVLDKDQDTENAKLSVIGALNAFEMADFVQSRRSGEKSLVLFLTLDDETNGRISGAIPPRSTPSRTLKEVLPVMLFEGSNTVCYATGDMALVVKSKYAHADVYFLNGEKTP